MIPPAVQLTFPCPACAHHLTLRTVVAHGPCPTCGTVLDVTLSVTMGAPPANQAPISLTDESPTQLRKFDERRFRPVLRPQNPPQS